MRASRIAELREEAAAAVTLRADRDRLWNALNDVLDRPAADIPATTTFDPIVKARAALAASEKGE